MNQTARQVGGALGVAILVVILGTPTSATQALHNFQHLWCYVAAMAALAGVAATLLGAPTSPSSVTLEVQEAAGVEALLDGEVPMDVLHPRTAD